MRVWKTQMSKITGERCDFLKFFFVWLKEHQKRNFLSPFQKNHFLIFPRKFSLEISNFGNFNFFSKFSIFHFFGEFTPKVEKSLHGLMIFCILHAWIAAKWSKLAYICSIFDEKSILLPIECNTSVMMAQEHLDHVERVC